MARSTVKRISEDEREYRGHTVYINTAVPKGYYGRYIVGSFNRGPAFSSLTDAKAHIDAVENAKTHVE